MLQRELPERQVLQVRLVCLPLQRHPLRRAPRPHRALGLGRLRRRQRRDRQHQNRGRGKSLGKLKKLHVIIIGVFVAIVLGAGMFFLLIKPRQQSLADVSKKLSDRQAVAAQLPSAKSDLQKAILENLQAKLDYRRYEDTKMPEVSFDDRTLGMIGLWREQAEVLGPMIEHWPRRYGVDLLNNVAIAAAPSNPNALVDGLLRIPVGTMQVRGDLGSILRHLKGWNDFHRLVQIDPMSISGTSPVLTATYSMTVLIFPRGKLGPNVAIAGTAAAAGAVGGAPGAVPGAMPGAGAPISMPGAPGASPAPGGAPMPGDGPGAAGGAGAPPAPMP